MPTQTEGDASVLPGTPPDSASASKPLYGKLSSAHSLMQANGTKPHVSEDHPQSGVFTSTGVAAELAQIVVGLGSFGNEFFKGAKLQAAVQHLAPGKCMDPCRSATCCWRWAAEVLANELIAIRRTAASCCPSRNDELSFVLEQELHDLRSAYNAMLPRYHLAQAESENLRQEQEKWKLEQAELLAEKEKIAIVLEAANRDHKISAVEAAAHALSLEEELLEAQRHPPPRELEMMLRAEMAKADQFALDVQEQEDEAMEVKIQRTELEWKVHRLVLQVTTMRRHNKLRQMRLARLRKKAEESRVPSRR